MIETRRDLVIFGSGFAAYEVARSAVARGQSVLVVEKGTASPDAANPALSAVPFRREPVVSGGFDFGAQVPAAFGSAPRYIGLGGTSELWSGKWRPLDEVDLVRTHDGRRWPVAPETFACYYAYAAAQYGWPAWGPDAELERDRALLATHGLRVVDIFEQTPRVRLRGRWSELASVGLEIVCDAVVREARFDAAGDTLRGVTIESGDGTRDVSAARFVIACGGIESVHVSHWLRQAAGAATASPDRYGGYMDHPKAHVGGVALERHRPVVETFQRARARGRLLALGLPEDEVASGGLGNHTLFLWPDARDGSRLQLVINLEQFPEAANFVTIAPPSVSWRLSQRTWSDYRAFMRLAAPRLERVFGPVEVLETPAFRGASHPAGALPMSSAPDGPIDPDCRVRGHHNLYCVSSAVFPLAGSANPTMTVVALARRLADHLRLETPH
jgi:choline dehydrogenase-like flavoprotein